jgi:hypothetical protein
MIMEGKGWRNKADPEEQNFQLQDQEGPRKNPLPNQNTMSGHREVAPFCKHQENL